MQTLSGLDKNLETHPGSLEDALAAYATDCSWAPVDAGDIPTQLKNWLDANSTEGDWLGRIADALEAVTGDPNALATVPYSALAASVGDASTLTRTAIDIKSPTIRGSESSAGYIGDPVNAATGNFIEPETDLTFTGACSTLALTRMYNALSSEAGVFGTG